MSITNRIKVHWRFVIDRNNVVKILLSIEKHSIAYSKNIACSK